MCDVVWCSSGWNMRDKARFDKVPASALFGGECLEVLPGRMCGKEDRKIVSKPERR